MDLESLFKHVYVDNYKKRTLLLLHGTGGDELNLLGLARSVAPDHNYLGIRGNAKQDSYNRYFVRFESGEFDENSIRTEAEKLNIFLHSAAIQLKFDPSMLDIIGFSNGGSFAVAYSFLYPAKIQKVAALHPMNVINPKENINLERSQFLITHGEKDEYVTPQHVDLLKGNLNKTKAHFEFFSHPGGHMVTDEEILKIRNFLKYE